MLAQGGMCVLPNAEDYDAFCEDTLRAGHYENRRESVDIMVRSSRAVLNDLMALGARFERDEHGDLAFTREGAHSRPRIVFHADITGEEITAALLRAVRRLPNVRMLEHTAMIDLLSAADGSCGGVVAMPVAEHDSAQTIEELRDRAATAQPASAGAPYAIRATNTLLATGGIGGVYEHSTNYPQLTGDACFLAHEYGVEQEHLDYVQIHPTGLYTEEPGRTFLISESCRGEGAVLLNRAHERFTDELQPRDVVARAIQGQMRADDAPCVWLSFAGVDEQVVRTHFANIRAHCLERGYDVLRESIPVVPTQHYFMGGVRIDRNAATSMPHLYAAGEAACNGVHGRNRLASNSLLEALVFARRAAWHMQTGDDLPVEPAGEPSLDGRHRALGSVPLGIDVIVSNEAAAARVS